MLILLFVILEDLLVLKNHLDGPAYQLSVHVETILLQLLEKLIIKLWGLIILKVDQAFKDQQARVFVEGKGLHLIDLCQYISRNVGELQER